MRANAEGDFREAQFQRAYGPYTINFPLDTQRLQHGRQRTAFDCLNTTVALYVFDSFQASRGPTPEAIGLESWLFRRWFEPYTTEIELYRSFVKTFTVIYSVAGFDFSAIQSESLVSMHCDVCEQSERFRDVMCMGKPSIHVPPRCGPLRGIPWRTADLNSEPSTQDNHWRHTNFIQPLFRALFKAIDYPRDNRPKDSNWMAEAHVKLVLTGITDGLSAPIALEELQEYARDAYTPGDLAITVTLSIATDFIIRLEKREIAAFGIQPNIHDLKASIKLRLARKNAEKAKNLGWIEKRDGSLKDLSLNSATWVNHDIFRTWLGQGAIRTMRYAAMAFSCYHRRIIYSQDWWWPREDLPKLAASDSDFFRRVAESTKECVTELDWIDGVNTSNTR
ncbi:hypothetical protein F5Y16DRAFT_102167 [Xylariaceae sp. FL0255]|nr:hypothetical protein F5Y16DRAFT_102167 [Xylariaceae sp. FL0255]